MCRHYKQQSRTILIFSWSSSALQISEPASIFAFFPRIYPDCKVTQKLKNTNKFVQKVGVAGGVRVM